MTFELKRRFYACVKQIQALKLHLFGYFRDVLKVGKNQGRQSIFSSVDFHSRKYIERVLCTLDAYTQG